MRCKRVLKRNDYSQYGHTAFMPSGNLIVSDSGGVYIYYVDHRTKTPLIRRWISDTWYDNVNTDLL